jgi:hypothetical protein
MMKSCPVTTMVICDIWKLADDAYFDSSKQWLKPGWHGEEGKGMWPLLRAREWRLGEF